jgi:asparagine synthase (glutamine-hydrolysing)
MSGIVGLFNLDGAPVDRSLLQRMTEFMTFRGPDEQQIWLKDGVGLGHTLLRTTWESEYEHQPYTLDQQVWIIADARVDGREALGEKLGIVQDISLSEISDVELILRAYYAWGEDCVHYLIGDFVFAIWDSRKQRLFCARDQFGIKLFYYSRVGNCLIISNTLNCIRQHPQVSNQLNEAAIGDFLLFDMNYNLETTTFADIQRLPPAHTLIFSNDTLKTQRYWTLPLPDLIRYKRSQDYIDHFHELMEQAVGDRLRTEKVGIFFSGGLDSTTIAAKALDVAKKRSQPLELQAFTAVYDQLIPDEERHYSSIAAEALGIPVKYLVIDDYELYEGWESPEFHTPEPNNEPLSIVRLNQLRNVGSHSRVALYGQGGDEAFKGSTVVELFKTMPSLALLLDVVHSLFRYDLRPPIGLGVYPLLLQWRHKTTDVPAYPCWLNSGFASRLNLSDRWQQVQNAELGINSPRSKAHHSLESPLWCWVFEVYDSGNTYAPVDVRLPFLDLRLLNYCLALPPIPWCVRKQLLRVAMKNVLPAKVIHRPKAPLAGEPVSIKFSQSHTIWQYYSKQFMLKDYVDISVAANHSISRQRLVWDIWERSRVASLGYWLQHSSKPTPLNSAFH